VSDDPDRYLDGTPDPDQAEDWETIEDADEPEQARVLGEVEGFKETEGLDIDDLRHQAELAGAALLHYAATGLLVAGALAVGAWALLEPPPTGGAPSAGGAATLVERARTHTARDRLEWALEIYRIDASDYPGKLSALVDRGLLRSRDLYYPLEGSRWDYRRTADGYHLAVEPTAKH